MRTRGRRSPLRLEAVRSLVGRGLFRGSVALHMRRILIAWATRRRAALGVSPDFTQRVEVLTGHQGPFAACLGFGPQRQGVYTKKGT